jgi:hypothetical protein
VSASEVSSLRNKAAAWRAEASSARSKAGRERELGYYKLADEFEQYARDALSAAASLERKADAIEATDQRLADLK